MDLGHYFKEEHNEYP